MSSINRLKLIFLSFMFHRIKLVNANHIYIIITNIYIKSSKQIFHSPRIKLVSKKIVFNTIYLDKINFQFSSPRNILLLLSMSLCACNNQVNITEVVNANQRSCLQIDTDVALSQSVWELAARVDSRSLRIAGENLYNTALAAFKLTREGAI